VIGLQPIKTISILEFIIFIQCFIRNHSYHLLLKKGKVIIFVLCLLLSGTNADSSFAAEDKENPIPSVLTDIPIDINAAEKTSNINKKNTIADSYNSMPVFTSEYTQTPIQPVQYNNRKLSDTTNDPLLDINPEIKQEVKSLLNKIKDPIKLKAYELGFLDYDDLLEKDNSSFNLINNDQMKEITNQLRKEQQDNPTKVTTNAETRNTYQEYQYNNEETTKELFSKIKIALIIIITLYLFYKFIVLIISLSKKKDGSDFSP